MNQITSFIGIFVFIGIAFLFSTNKKKIDWQLVIKAIILQFVLAVLVLGIPSLDISGPLAFIFDKANALILRILNFSEEGSRFLFGSLLDREKHGFIIAFTVLPTIVFMSALMSVMYHIGIMQWVVRGFAYIMYRGLKVSGAESLAAAANIFVGQTEAPLIIRPYLAKMTSSELFCVMVGGMATVAGGVLAAYVGFLKDLIPGIGGHLLTASVLSAPAALLMAKVMLPELQKPETADKSPPKQTSPHINILEAAANGASEGVTLAINVGGMLLAFIALISLADFLLIKVGTMIAFQDWGPTLTGEPAKLSLDWAMSWLFSPFSFFMGIPWEDIPKISVILGKKTVFNEFIAYLDLAKVGPTLTDRSMIICSYALCGFSNFSSIAIQLGGIGSLAPERKKELALFGLRAVIGGSLACFITACIAGVLI
ncbi:MAG: NupC/NupG family nucleoside CNT transporter [Bdellovibrionaceae bacterium]|nr:NupC/NupG family nucleoside CNT transporter [Pseudobdellovibrionaceae bacterium]